MKRFADRPSSSGVKRAREEPEKTRKAFDVPSVAAFSGRSPFFRQPVEIGSFSLDGERKFHNDRRQLRRFNCPHKIDFDLRVGYKEFIARDEEKREGLDNLLMWVQEHRDKFQIVGSPLAKTLEEKEKTVSSLNTDFVTWRGHLTKIMCSPYEKSEPWQMAATLYNGTIYISEVETEEGRERRRNMEAKHKEMCYWGYKFEDYVTAPIRRHEESEAVEKQEDLAPVNSNEGFITVIRSRLEGHSLVFGAEVDCCMEDNGKGPSNYLELKTSMNPDKPHKNWTFMRYKLIKWWAQSYLAGIPKVICGLRDNNGRVCKLQTYNTLEIPRIVRRHERMWDATVCINFLDRFLTWVKSVIGNTDTKVYLFSWRNPFTQVTVSEVQDNSHDFLPEWFMKSKN